MATLPNACAFSVSNTPGTGSGFTIAAVASGPYRIPRAAEDGAEAFLFVREGDTWEICESVYDHATTTWSRGTLSDSSGGSVARQSFTSACIVSVIGLEAGEVSGLRGLALRRDASGIAQAVQVDGTDWLSHTTAPRFMELLSTQRARIGAVGNSIVASSSDRSFVASAIGRLAGSASATLNVAVSGANSEDMLSQVASVDALSNVVVMMEGTNDAAQSFSVADHVAGMRAVGQAIAARGMVPLLVACPPRDTTVSTTLAYHVAEYALAEDEGWPWVDPWARYTDTDGSWTAGATTGDGDHPTSLVHQQVGEDMGDAIIARTMGRLLARADSGHGLLTGALMLTDSNADGIPDGWGKFGYTSGGVLAAAPHPCRGNRLTLTLSQTADVELYRSVPLAAVADGDEILVTGLVGVTAINNARVVVWMTIYDGGELTQYRVVASVAGSAHAERPFVMRMAKPAGLTAAAAMQIWYTVASLGGSYTATVTLAAVQAFNLTAALA